MPAYPQVAHFDVSLANLVSLQFLKNVRTSVPSSELVRLRDRVSRIDSDSSSLLKTLKDKIPYQCLDDYLNAAFRCTVLPVEAIALQLTFVVIADLSSRGISDGFADYRNSDGSLVKGEAFWKETVNHFGLSFGVGSDSPIPRRERSSFDPVVLLHQQLRYPESPMPRYFGIFDVPSRQQRGRTVEDYYDSKFQNELKEVVSQTVEFVRQVNHSLSKIEISVLHWRSALKMVEEFKPKFWLGENAKSFDLAMTELNKLFRLKEPQITSPIRAVRKLLAHRVKKFFPVDTEIPELIKQINILQEEIALRESPVGEALSDLNKFRLLTERGTLKKQLDEKCGRLLQIRQDLSSIHQHIVEDFDELANSLKTFQNVITETRSRFCINQVPKFFGDTKLSSQGIMFERAGSSSAKIAMQTEFDDAELLEKATSFLEGSVKEGVGLATVAVSKSFVSAAQAGEVSKSFLTTMRVAPLVGALVQIHLARSDAAEEKDRIIDVLKKSLPIPDYVFEKFVQKEIEKVFNQSLFENIFKFMVAAALISVTGGVTAIILAGAFALAQKIEESEEYKELVTEIQTAVARGFKNWEQSLVVGNS